ncbi:LysE family transporter [Pseudonocardia sp. CA-107938]|uniref:LysE family transporter n=1 Tax=Pseudonocardia sp. CA-107938 TaxID=3240021 RepID=UPI003D90181C
MSGGIGAALVAGLVAGYGIAMPIGAVGAYLVQLSARSPWRTGVAAALGVASTDGVFALVAVLGGAAVAALLAPAVPVLRWVSTVVLVLLAARTVVAGLRAGGEAAAVPDAAPGRTYFSLVGLTAVNPTTVVYFVALVVGLPDRPVGAAAAVFVAAAFAASASWQLLVAGAGMALGRFVAAPPARRLTAIVSGAVMLLLAAHIGWSS